MVVDSADAIEPPDAWRIQSPHGVLKTNTGVRLARLEDVHAWLMQRDGMSSASAVARVFAVFAADASSAMGMEHGSTRVRESLHILDLSHDAEPVRGWAGQHYLREVADLIPYVPHHRFDRGTAGALMYALGLIAGEVWAPHAVEIDLNDRLDGYCAEGYFPTVTKAREILGRFAVPFAAAHALWGWGTVSAAGSVATVPVFPLADWPALVAFRKANPGSDWGQGNQVAIGKNELALRVKNGNTESDALAEMAHEVRLKSRQAMHKALNRERMRAKKKERAAAAQPATQVRDGKRQPKAA